MVIILLPTIIFLLIRNNQFQNFIGQKVIASLSRKTGHEIAYSRLKINLFNKVTVYDFLINDQNNDTLFFIPKLQVNLKQFNREKRILHFSKVSVKNAYINFQEDSTAILNITKFIGALKKNKKDTANKKWNVYISNLEMDNARFEIKKYLVTEKEGLDFSNLQLYNLNLMAKGFQMEGDSIGVLFKKMSFNDISGFRVESFNANVGISKNGMSFKDGLITTPALTILSFENIDLLFSDYKDLSKGSFADKVTINMLFNPSSISFKDLRYLSGKIPPREDVFTFAGKIYGWLNDLKLRELEIALASNTTFKGKVDMNGLPNMKNTFLFIDIDHFATTMADVSELLLSNKQGAQTLPKALYESGTIQYKGKFTGFIDDFVSYGIVFTDLGIISTDLLIKPDTAKYVGFKGSIKAHNFNIGAFTGKPDKLGEVSLIANIKGSSSKENKIYAELDGKVMKLDLLGYSYKNIELNGKLSDKFFDGSFSIDDPCLQFDFNGNMDFSKEIPIFNFDAQLYHANLYKLHLVENDSLYKMSFQVKADFSGVNIDALDGKITVTNSIFEKTGKKLEVDNLSILARHTDDRDRLDVFCDFFNGYISGKYDFSKINITVKQFKNNYLPSLAQKKTIITDSIYNQFNYNFECVKTDALCEFFFPNFCIAEGSSIYGNFNPTENDFTLTCISPELITAGKSWKNFQLNLITTDSVFSINTGCESLQLAENLKLDNFTLISDLIHDNIYINTRWNNWDTLLNKGNIIAKAVIQSSSISSKPKINFYIEPSTLVYGNTKWDIHESSIKYDSAYLVVDKIQLTNDERIIEINGQLSGKRDDLLHVTIRNFNMASINLFTEPKGLLFGGDLNGTATISEIFTNPIIDSDFLVDTLVFNGEKLGETVIQSKWDNGAKKIDIGAQIKRGLINTIEINGSYIPGSKGMDFHVHLDKLKMDLFNLYLSSTFSDIVGAASGDLTISGTSLQPRLDGYLDLQKAALTVNYLNTRYFFADRVVIENNNVLIKDIELNYKKDKKAMLNGQISTKYLKDINLHLTLDANNLCFLNTTAADNNQFYGNVFASGNIRIEGPIKDIHITAKIKTEKDTELSIPLSSEEVVYENTFISWRSKGDSSLTKQVSKSNDVNVSGITLDFDVELTPDAEAQLIFDPKVGDVIKSRGYGNLKLSINTSGKFQMYGDYKIEDGDYLFTLQNVINKKFKVEKGSTIIWNGDASDADIDIAAVYRLKTSTTPLFENPSEQNARRVNVECRAFLTNKLMNPNIRFEISVPGADEETKTALREATSTEEDLNKQFLYLLVLNSFYTEPNKTDATVSTETSGSRSNVAGVTTSELLSNQLSHWLSQISNDFDIGVNYRPGDEITSDEVELALSTQVLNDRVSINGNLDVGGTQMDDKSTDASSANNIMGDFDVDVKLTKSGKLRVKAFNRANDQLLYEKSPYTQGVGFFYREEFDDFGDLVTQYWNRIFRGEK